MRINTWRDQRKDEDTQMEINLTGYDFKKAPTGDTP